MIGWVLMAKRSVGMMPFWTPSARKWATDYDFPYSQRYWRLFDEAERLGVTVEAEHGG